MLTPALVLSAFGAILIALVGAMVISAIPDPNRQIINALPDTKPDIKTPANQALDAQDAVNSWKDMATLWKNLMPLLLGIGIPSGIVGALILGSRR